MPAPIETVINHLQENKDGIVNRANFLFRATGEPVTMEELYRVVKREFSLPDRYDPAYGAAMNNILQEAGWSEKTGLVMQSKKDINKIIIAMLDEGKTKEDIIKILSADGPVEEAAVDAAIGYAQELKKEIQARIDKDMGKIKEEFEIDTAITPVYDLYKKTLLDELGS